MPEEVARTVMLTGERRAVSVRGDTSQLAQLAADLEQARAAIGLWQFAVLRMRSNAGADPAHGDAKLLDGVKASAAGWMAVLRASAAQGEDVRALAAFTREAMLYAEWAEEARLALYLVAEIQTLDLRP